MQVSRTGLIPPAYAGVALLLSWTYLTFYANTAGIGLAAPVSLMSAAYSLSTVCMVATLIIIAFSKRIGSVQLTSIPAKVITPLGLSFGTLLLFTNGFDYQTDFGALALLGSILTGIFSGILTQQWVLVFSRIGLRVAVCSFPALMAAATGTSLLLMYLPKPIMLAGTILLPIISEAMLHSVRHSIVPHYDIDASTSDRPIDFVLLLLPIVVYSFASGFLDFFSSESPYAFVFYGLVGFIPLILAGAFIFLTNRENIVPTLVVPLLFLVALFVPFFTLFNATPTARFISIGELATEVVLVLCTIGFAEFFSLSPFKTFALSRTVYALLNSVGWYAAGFSSQALDGLGNSLASLTVVFVSVEVFSVVLIVAIVKAQKADPAPHPSGREYAPIPAGDRGESAAGGVPEDDPPKPSSPGASRNGQRAAGGDAGGGPGSAPRNQTTSIPSETEIDMAAASSNEFENRCLKVGQEFALSSREIDVLRLLARGYSSARIQSELYIAAGTVNYHTRNIYAKLGVHSKQEVIDLVAKDLD